MYLLAEQTSWQCTTDLAWEHACTDAGDAVDSDQQRREDGNAVRFECDKQESCKHDVQDSGRHKPRVAHDEFRRAGALTELADVLRVMAEFRPQQAAENNGRCP